MQAKSGRVTKLMPRSDGPFTVIRTHPETSNYTIELPNEPNQFATFHASQLRPFCSNDNELFPSRTLPQPGPVVTTHGQEEWLIRDIIDERVRGRGMQYLVRWFGATKKIVGYLDKKWRTQRLSIDGLNADMILIS